MFERASSAKHVEQLGEETLFGRRLCTLESELAAGSSEHAPLDFLTGLEVECAIGQAHLDGNIMEALVNASGREKLAAQGILVPGGPMKNLITGDTGANLARTKTEAWALIERLEPQNEAERRRRRQWLDEIADFRVVDAINFEVYQRFSRPTLGPAGVPRQATYDTIRSDAAQGGWLEFRFGPGTLQSGYYDNPNLSEMRFNPCPPSELAYRERTVAEYFAQVATGYNAFALRGSRHINLSAYQADEQGMRRSILGNEPGRRAFTLDAIAGVVQAIEDGVWLHAESKEQLLNFYDVAANRFFIGVGRTAIRIKDSYLELRSSDLIGDTEHGLLFLLAGISHGLHKGWAHVASQGYQVPVPTERLIALPGQAYEKQRHLQVLRTLQNSELEDGGRLRLSPAYNLARDEQIAQALGLGEGWSKVQYQVFNYIAVKALRVDNTGTVHCTPQNLRQAYQDLREAGQQSLADEIGALMHDDHIEALAGIVDEQIKTVRFEKNRFIEAQPHYKGLSPAKTWTRLLQSEIFQRAYGEYAKPYANYLYQQVQPAYRAATFEQVLEAALRQALGDEPPNTLGTS